jgi:uncharacterized protein (TIGR02757 family)
MKNSTLAKLLEEKSFQYNCRDFIADDPISIPHSYTKLQDIEITAFFAATLAWGQRKTIIQNCRRLFALMDNAPHDFILGHTEHELKPFLGFVHRTFNDTDLLYFIEFLRHHYTQSSSLETAFTEGVPADAPTVEAALRAFHERFFSLAEAPSRTRKHVATPARKSACKRLCMFLRWMVRHDAQGVDFGVWKTLKMNQLICPLDVHVERVGRLLGLLQRPTTDWQAALELTENLRRFDAQDPVRYDFALFGLGLEKYSG